MMFRIHYHVTMKRLESLFVYEVYSHYSRALGRAWKLEKMDQAASPGGSRGHGVRERQQLRAAGNLISGRFVGRASYEARRGGGRAVSSSSVFMSITSRLQGGVLLRMGSHVQGGHWRRRVDGDVLDDGFWGQMHDFRAGEMTP